MGLETNMWCFIECRSQPVWAGAGLLDNARVSNYKNYRVLDEDIDTIQNRAIHFYLVHKFAPNLAINGDVGWISSSVRRKSEMLHYWNRLIHMDSERLTKKVFHWDFNRRRTSGNWNSDIYKVFSSYISILDTHP